MKHIKKGLALLLALVVTLPLLAACGKDEGGESGAGGSDTLVVGSQELNGIFTPVFYRTGYDGVIADYTQVSMLKNDRAGNLESLACEYQAPVQYKENGEDYVKYTYKLKEGIVFSDGTPLTSEDIIFTYKLYLDPSYDGLATVFTLPIVGLNEYRFDDPNYEATQTSLKQKAETEITDEYVLNWLMNTYGIDEATAKDYINDPDERPLAIEAYYEELVKNSVSDKLSGGSVAVPDISGIKKVDELTVEITLKGIDPTAEYKLPVSILPKHYYGAEYKKGDLSGVKKLNGAPLGAGAYLFESFQNNIVTLKANENYFLGKPKIETIKYQVIDVENRLDEVKRKNCDIADPSADMETVEKTKQAGLHYELIDNNGYGYIGINAERITDKNLRKALMHLMDRKPAVDSYYGELASIIERPTSKVSWAYPQNATEYYGYNVEKALEYFTTAGYTQQDGKLVKDGEQFRVELWLSSATHPVVPVFNQMKIDIENLGGICEVMTVDWAVYSENYQNGLIDVWAAAWSSTIDPDIYQTYHSSQIATNNNPYRLNNAELDKLIIEGRSTMNKSERATIYAKAYDIIMDEAVEMPFYQRKNLIVFNQKAVDVSTIPENLTPYYGWDAEIEKLALVQ